MIDQGSLSRILHRIARTPGIAEEDYLSVPEGVAMIMELLGGQHE